MAQRLQDLNLPNMTVQRIIRDVLPPNVNIAKDAKSALSRASSLFILYITSQATKVAHQQNRKTLLGKDIVEAIGELEFDEFIQPLEAVLKEFNENKIKRAPKKKKDSNEKTEVLEETIEEPQTDEELNDNETTET